MTKVSENLLKTKVSDNLLNEKENLFLKDRWGQPLRIIRGGKFFTANEFYLSSIEGNYNKVWV